MKAKTLTLLGLGAAAAALFASPVRADEKGEHILREAYKLLGDSQAMTATITQTIEGDTPSQKIVSRGTVSAMKPNLLLVRILLQTDSGQKRIENVYAATGKEYISYSFNASTEQGDAKNTYRKEKLAPNPTEFNGEWEGEIDAFFGGEKNLDKGTADYTGMDKIGDFPCNIVKVKIKAKGETPERTITYYVGQKDHLIHRTSWVVKFRDGELTEYNTLTDINLKATKKPEDFDYTPPKGAKVERPKRDVIFF